MGPEHAHAIGLATDMAVMSLLALSAYLLLLAGRISFGQQAYFGLGAYASALATTWAQWPLAAALAGAGLVGAAAAFALALPTSRLSGLHHAVATLAFAEMLRIALQGWHWRWTGADGAPAGPNGIDGFRDIRWLLENDVSDAAFLGLAAGVLGAVLLALALLWRCRAALALRAVGQDDTLAAAQGTPVRRVRLAAATVAGAVAALGGALYAHRTTYIEPALFDPMLGVHAVGYALIGGLGTVFGPLLGVAFDLGLLDATRVFAGWRMVVFGGLVALFLRWRPRGLLDEATLDRLASFLGRRRAPPIAPSLETVR
ncbi:branched-chain amino acid ABC transporter permease [Variovorax sp. PvP013]|jgi:branched-chain amino acid transport system permease protein|uniref:branched-chain amino acid ABC transporter permease n=1 Tax=Variovorax sp. PvP013 TaxID=3156435 RepID=UPI003D23E47D